MDAHIEDLWLVFVTSNFKRNPTDPEAMRTRDFAEVISKDLKLLAGQTPMRAELEVMHKSESSNHPDKKFRFSCFVNGVVKVATRKKNPNKTPDQQVAEFITKYIKPLAKRRPKKDILTSLESVSTVFERLKNCLKDCFMFFATLPSEYEKKELDRHKPRSDINGMTQSMGFGEWSSFCSLFNLSSSIGAAVKALSPNALASAYVDSIQVKHVDNLGGLTFEEFWEAIVRCCLIFKKDSETLPTPEDKVKATLQHMANNLETAVQRLLKLGNITEGSGVAMAGMQSGGRNVSSAGALIQGGTHEFTRIVFEIIREGETGEAEVKPTAFDAKDAEDKVWRIFLKANLTNNPRDWQAMRKRELVLIVRAQKKLKLMEADVNVIHQQEAGRNPGKRLEFKEFQSALRSIAKRAFPKEAKESDDTALSKLLNDYLLKTDDLLHNELAISAADWEVAKEWLGFFDSPLKRIFSFFATFATDHEKNVLDRHAAQEEGINQQTCSMKWSDFLNFCAPANLSSGTGTALTALSLSQLGAAFADSIEVSKVNDLGGITYEEFRRVLTRCALLFDYDEADTCRIRLEKLFLHMCNQFQTSVPRIINDGAERVGAGGQTAGGRNISTNGGLLLKGVREFNKIFQENSKHLNIAEKSIFKFGDGSSDDQRRGSSLLDFTAGLKKGLS